MKFTPAFALTVRVSDSQWKWNKGSRHKQAVFAGRNGERIRPEPHQQEQFTGIFHPYIEA